MITIGSDFSGVGAFNQALKRLNIDYKEVFACDMDKYARQTFIHNYGDPEYYPENVYNRVIPEKSLDIYMTSPPCQAFSLAGKREGENSDKGVLFYNSHEFISLNKPRFFIFENVKGLLSDDNERTFQRWIAYLGGKSVNSNPVMFKHEKAVDYHVYYRVMNAKNYGVPQNRERIFIIGIRDDCDNNFTFPKEISLTKRLKDILEENVPEKYYLSEKALEYLSRDSTGNYSDRLSFMNYSENEKSTCITANHSKGIPYNMITIGGAKIGAIRGLNPQNPTLRISGQETVQMLELNENGTSNALTTVQKDNVVIQMNPSKESGGKQPFQQNRAYDSNGIMTTLDCDSGRKSVYNDCSIRRLTPRECFRLMDFPDTFTWPVSDSQAYKQAGNSIVVSCLVEIIKKLHL